MVLGPNAQTFGNQTDTQQLTSGAMMKIGTYALSGASATREISGDADFALGRWAAGTVTSAWGADTLTLTDRRSYHYVVLNGLAAWPADRSTTTCDHGVFTSPTYLSGTGTKVPGTTTGTPTLEFYSRGARVGGNLTVTVEGTPVSVDLDSRLPSPTSSPITGGFLSGGTGAAIMLGTTGTNAYVLAVGYAVVLPSGSRYQGVAKFSCA
ncbi:hypothetical protein [Variovorax rhizosphaerae]|uniref:Uncharacterized protein n=1 Tax=Variovorax rhizosphaerae TaxID=1836200 RepID=A0ABU8WFR8_9BURK